MKKLHGTLLVLCMFSITLVLAHASTTMRNSEEYTTLLHENSFASADSSVFDGTELSLYARKEQNLHDGTQEIVFGANAQIFSDDELIISKDLSCREHGQSAETRVFSHGYTTDAGFGYYDAISLVWNNHFLGQRIDCDVRIQDIGSRPYPSTQLFASFNLENYDFPNIDLLELLEQKSTGEYVVHLALSNPVSSGGIAQLNVHVLAEDVVRGITHEYNEEFSKKYTPSIQDVGYYLVLQDIPSHLTDSFFTIELSVSSPNGLETSTIMGVSQEDIRLWSKKDSDVPDSLVVFSSDKGDIRS